MDGALNGALYNTAVGYAAGQGGSANLTDSIIIGSEAASNTGTNTQTGIMAIGYQALTALTTGAGNLAIGYQALLTHTTGGQNIAIGYGAMDDTDAGSTSLGSTDNIFIGMNTGGGTWTDVASSHNTGIGNFVMDSALAGAAQNVAIGHYALSSITTSDGNVAVGANAA